MRILVVGAGAIGGIGRRAEKRTWLALQPDFIAWEDIRSGTLERVLPEWAAPPLAVNIITPIGGTRLSRVSALLAFLVQNFAEAVAPGMAIS
jgi:DNA-binding transcriptional LysR family regulator